MRSEKRSPASLADGDRASGFINVAKIDYPRIIPPHFKIQDLPPPDFDPAAMPNLAAHWPGLSVDKRRPAA